MINIPILCIGMLLVGFIIHSFQIHSINNSMRKEIKFNTSVFNALIESEVDIQSLKEDVVELMKELSRIRQSKIEKFKEVNLNVKRSI